MIWAAVPLKSPDHAKSRLGNMLDASQRRRLQAMMARRVIAALTTSPDIDHVLVVTPSVALASLADDMGAHSLMQPAGGDLPDACELAMRAACAGGASGLLWATSR
jgi:2-phospho-L-lactate guanylyltransferase (CobY/MobA/RfbA family)